MFCGRGFVSNPARKQTAPGSLDGLRELLCGGRKRGMDKKKEEEE